MADTIVHMSGDETKLFRSYQRIIDQATKLDQKHKEVKKSSQDTFGDSAASQLANYVTRLATATAVIGGIQQALAAVRAEAERLGQMQRTGGPSLGTLAQLAETPAQLDRMVSEAKRTLASGGAKTMEQAAAMQFSLESAGAGGMRADFAQLQATGLVPNAQLMAESASKLQKAFGKAKTGNLSQIVSTAFGGGKIGLGTAEELLTGAAGAGVFAQRIGLSPEETLAAVSAISGTLGPQGAGTAAEQLFKNIEVQGIVQTGRLKRGAGLAQYIKQIQALEKKGVPISEILGNRSEAIVGYGLLTNTEGQANMAANMANIGQAQRENWMGMKLGLASGIPENRAAMAAQVGENRGVIAGTRAGVVENLADAIEEDLVRKYRKRYGAIGAVGERWGINMDRFTGNEQFVKRWAGDASEETQEAVRRFYEVSEALNTAAQNLSDSTGRQRAAVNAQPE